MRAYFLKTVSLLFNLLVASEANQGVTLRGRRSIEIEFSHIAEIITVNKPTDEFYLEISYIFSSSRFYWFCFNN